jgi:hypothetical protein
MSTFRWLLPVSVALCLLVRVSPADEPKKEVPPAFKEYVGIYTKSDPKVLIILQQPKVKQLGDRAFLVGTPVHVVAISEEPGVMLEPNKVIVRWIALAEVLAMYEFDDAKGYRRLSAE